MAKRITNLELRGRSWYYRVSFTLNRKTFSLRLSLETADPVVARERASRMDLALKRRWREMVASPIWAIRIRVNAGGRLKNVAAVRDLPIADAVIALGFLDFVELQKAAGQTFLFPELRRETGAMGDVFYKKWWRAYERAGLVPDGKDIHSIRHYVSTSLAAVDVSEERRADLLGHTLSGETAGRYTKRTPLPLLRDIVNLLPLVTRGVDRGR